MEHGFVHDKAATKKLVQELFIDRDIVQTTEGESSAEENTTNKVGESKTAISKSDIKIEILNGSGESKRLQEAVNELEGAGFKVSRTGSTNVAAKTTIIDKKNVNDTLLKSIKETLGVGSISDSQSTSSKVDVTIIIGRDYK